MSTLRTPKQDPKQFKPGERVRIYLGHSTDSEILVREGEVLKHKKNRRWGMGDHLGRIGDALVLRVEKTGKIIRKDSGDISLPHRVTGDWITGKLETETLTRPYTGSYFYSCISGAEKII